MKKCPNCGKSVDNDAVRCSCGASLTESVRETATNEVGKNGRLGRYQMTLWDIFLLIVCNVSFTVLIVNLVIGGAAWCHFVILGLFGVYFLAFACASGSAKKFMSRYRNAVIWLNIICGICGLIPKTQMSWANNYFIPCNLILAGFVFLCLLFNKNIKARHVIYSIILLLLQSGTQFILFLFDVIGGNKVADILIILAFGLNLMTLVNIVFLYFAKFKNQVAEKFRWWE